MYYQASTVDSVLQKHPQLKEKLYCRGFLITSEDYDIKDYPFYGNWNKRTLSGTKYLIYTHVDTKGYVYEEDGKNYFLIGHAYNPYESEIDELIILQKLAKEDKHSRELFWNKAGDLSGVFTYGIIREDDIVLATDAAGMSMTYYGLFNNSLVITSHSKMVADFYKLKQDPYIVRLVNSRFYKYWGMWLPGDLSPFKEMKRVVPNFMVNYNNSIVNVERFFPKEKIVEVNDEIQYQEKLNEIKEILQSSLKLISKKWPQKKAALSLTGGRDSTTTLACAREVYGELKYFSYISAEKERVDAEAASKICKYTGNDHVIYKIPNNDEEIPEIDIHRILLECNAGCIGKNNENDVRKRAWFNSVHDFDIEIKSWVSELSRAEAQNKYGTTKWPIKPTPGYYRCMWKVIVSPRLIHESNLFFREYLRKYCSGDVIQNIPWTDLFFWEFSWPAGEGQFLTSEQKYAYDITIPYSNRHLLKTMLETPFTKRLNSCIQKDLVHMLDPRIEEADCFVKNMMHTDLWTTIIRAYVRIFSKFVF